MVTSHCRRRGYILLLVLSYSSVFGLASNMDISNDAKEHESTSTSIKNGTDMGKEYITCAESNMKIPWEFYCEKSPKDVITKINFADYGNPSGKCEHFRHGNCGAPATLRLTRKNCIGKNKCMLLISDEMFGPTNCKGDLLLLVQGICRKP